MRAASSSSLKVTLTPTLMLGAKTIGTVLAADSIARRPASSKPVVPMTAPTRWRTQDSRCASVPAGRVKSMRKSAFARTSSMLALMDTPVLRPRNSPASRPIAGLPATSSAPASSMSSASSAASTSIRPIRPVAPAIATFRRDMMFSLDGRGSGVVRRAIAGQGRVAGILDLRQRIRIDLRDAAVLEDDDHPPQLGVTVGVQVAEYVVPALGREHVHEQRRAEGESHLLGAHARAHPVEHLARDVVALGDVEAMRLEDAAAARVPRRAGAQQGCRRQRDHQGDAGCARSGRLACRYAGIRHGNVDIGWLDEESAYDKRSRADE